MMTLPNASDFIQAFVKRRRFKTWTCQDQGHKSSIEQKQNNMLLNDYKSEVHLKWSQLQRPHHLHKRKTSCQSKELLKCITALWFLFWESFLYAAWHWVFVSSDLSQGWFSRLCLHFFVDLTSSGCPMSFPRSFKPVEGESNEMNATNLNTHMTRRLPMALSILPMTWLLGIAFPHS